MSTERTDASTPLIKLGREFTSVEDYLRRIPHGVPTITHLDHLTVAGDVFFGENVTLKVGINKGLSLFHPRAKGGDSTNTLLARMGRWAACFMFF